jgi:beta-galactosidase GanA
MDSPAFIIAAPGLPCSEGGGPWQQHLGSNMKAIAPRHEEIFGGEIQYFRIDPRAWEPILDRFVETGLPCVSCYVQWATHLVGEPDAAHPAGVLDFEGRTDPRLNLRRFLELITRRGLRLNFRCGPFCCNEAVHGGYPPWLVLGDPNLMVWDYQNRTTQGYWIAKKEGSQPSYLHPDYLTWCKRWFDEVDRIVLENLHSRGGCISMINLDNEISYIVKDGFLDSDYNPVNVQAGGFYHQFLAEQYGSVANLPYPRKYSSFEEVPPPRSVPETVGDDFGFYADWMRFKTWVMCRYIERLRAMHEANGVCDVMFMTNFNPHRPEGVPTRMPDFEKASGGIVGYDFYRGVFMSYSGYHSIARVLKLMNASLSYSWSAEFMSGTWNKDLTQRGRVSDEHMRFMARCALAHGCKAISWFMFHDREIWGDAPVSSLGHSRPSLAVLTETYALVSSTIRNWGELHPLCDCAIVYSPAAAMHTAIGDPSPSDDNALHIGKPLVDGIEAGRGSAEYEGLFRLVEQAGYQASAADLSVRPDALQGIPLVFLPGSPVLEQETADALQRYVQSGGTLVVTGAFPTRDEFGGALVFTEKKRVIRHPTFIAQEAAEEESLECIECVRSWLKESCKAAHVSVVPDPMPHETVDWAPKVGGKRLLRQPRNLLSAILQKAEDEEVLFLLNHYIDATFVTVTFKSPVLGLVNLDTQESLKPDSSGVFHTSIDRKTCNIFHVER